MRREQALKVVLVLVELLFCAGIYGFPGPRPRFFISAGAFALMLALLSVPVALQSFRCFGMASWHSALLQGLTQLDRQFGSRSPLLPLLFAAFSREKVSP